MPSGLHITLRSAKQSCFRTDRSTWKMKHTPKLAFKPALDPVITAPELGAFRHLVSRNACCRRKRSIRGAVWIFFVLFRLPTCVDPFSACALSSSAQHFQKQESLHCHPITRTADKTNFIQSSLSLPPNKIPQHTCISPPTSPPQQG